MPKSNLNNSATLLFFLRRSPLPRGYTLTELLVTMVILGVLSAMALTLTPWYENPLRDGRDRILGTIKLSRIRAMGTTSTYRVSLDDNSPTKAIKVQRTRAGNCEAVTTLGEDIEATDTELPVVNTSGFSVGDEIEVGGSTTHDVLSVNPDSNALVIGSTVGRDLAAGTSVVLVKDWQNDAIFTKEDTEVEPKNTRQPKINLNGKIGGTSTNNWSICINSRGFLRLYNNSVQSNNDLDLVLTNTQTNEQSTISISPGGAVDSLR